MISRHTFAIAAALAVTALSGCATAPPTMHHTDPNHSQAWNLTRAAGYEILEDVEHEKVEQQIDTNGASLGGTLAAGGLGFLSNPNGLSLGGNVGMNMLTNLLLGGDVPKAGGTNIVAWIPKSEAATSDEAIVQAKSRITTLARAGMEAMQMPTPYHWERIRQTDSQKASYDALIGYIGGGECETASYICEVRFSIPMLGKASQQINDAVAPAVLGGYPAWRVEFGVSYYFRDTAGWTATKEPHLPMLRLLNGMSTELPRSYFIYIAPNRMPFQKNESEYALFPAPMVLHEGQALYFIEPAPGA
ncbi:hypothetical protein C84B14_09082 [Salinisphaera sp. C84B14]|uniref:hypothetical protein n=1 Tax=Salinisphaera sp. C84B14 TaxID=1304155 RepID=UPI0033415E35